MSDIPAVFVSSTYYDLRQIRVDLSQFIEKELGYKALLSEKASFPIDPDTTTIENCRRRVEKDADLFVLAIGGRYGSIDQDTAKSVTNLEYLTALAKRIPIYVFVEKSVLAYMRVWADNRMADFSAVTDNPLLFEFIERIRSIDKVWVYEFETAQDIIEVLRIQFAYRMAEGLQLLAHFHEHPELAELTRLSTKAFRVALEEPPAWEYRLFCQALMDEIKAREGLRSQHKWNILLGEKTTIVLDKTAEWCDCKMDELNDVFKALNILFDQVLQDALGPAGVAGNKGAIVSTAQHIGEVYAHAIEWSQCIKRARVHPAWQGTVDVLATFADQLMDQIEAVGPDVMSKIEAILQMPEDETPNATEHVIVLEIPNIERFEQEMAATEKRLAELGVIEDQV